MREGHNLPSIQSSLFKINFKLRSVKGGWVNCAQSEGESMPGRRNRGHTTPKSVKPWHVQGPKRGQCGTNIESNRR